MKRTLLICTMMWPALLAPTRLHAHAFLDHAEPAVGSKVAHAPTQVKIWFSEDIESAFSSIKVLDSANHEVQQGKAQTDKAHRQILQVGLPALASGSYKVTWRAVSVDTHVTQGTFSFTVGP